MLTLVSCAIGALGGGGWSIDHAVGFTVNGWAGLAIAAGAGGAGAALLLATCWRPGATASPASAPSSASAASSPPAA
jgi:putative oxidoreductase